MFISGLHTCPLGWAHICTYEWVHGGGTNTLPGYPILASLFLLSCVSHVPFLKGQFTRMPPGIVYRGQHLGALDKTAGAWDSPGDLYNRRDCGSHACHGAVQPTPRSSHLPLYFLCYSMSPSYPPNINLKVLYDSKLNNSCNPHNSRKFHNYPFLEVRKMRPTEVK